MNLKHKVLTILTHGRLDGRRPCLDMPKPAGDVFIFNDIRWPLNFRYNR